MPGRKILPHDIPSWIDPAREIWFLTVCCQKRSVNQLARPDVWPILAESIERRVAMNLWWMHLFVAMPDHCHAIVSFPPTTVLFEHRLRCEESFEEKYADVRENPVRARLVEAAENWPYLWRPKEERPLAVLRRK